eukprot:GGOE01002164.1.p1 GENE.GGOE01002164.1~~GGOE01002164.1.p1  ORF type:complete len:644 (+),score=192.42 GGOE01002164.1:276-1934(+)
MYEPKGDQKVFKPVGSIPQVRHTYAYFDQNYGLTNEVGLSISESTAAAKTVGWPVNVPHGNCLFDIRELSKVALERCDTARDAVQTMGDLAVKHGFYSSFNGEPEAPWYDDNAEILAVADHTGEIWIFHIMTGPKNASAVWAAQRVPDDMVLTAPNTFVIREIDFSDSDNFLYSDNVRSFAKEMGWWKPSDSPFDFTRAYANPNPIPVIPLYDGRRMWRIYDLVAPSLKLDSTLGYLAVPGRPQYPLAVRPDTKVTLQKLFDILRDHYEGTEYDMSKGLAAGPFGNPVRWDGVNGEGVIARGELGAWERPISIFRAQYSFVMQIRPEQPKALATVMWYGLDAPHGAVYVPFYSSQRTVPQSYLEGKQSEFSTKSAYWAFNFVNNWCYNMWVHTRKDVVAAQKRLEEDGVKFQAKVDKAVAAMGSRSAQRYIEVQQEQFAESVVSQWWALAWHLVGKFNNGYIVLGEEEGQMITPGYPVWWLKAMKYDQWPGDSYFTVPSSKPGRNRPVNRTAQLPESHGFRLSHLLLVTGGAIATFVAMRAGSVRRRYEAVP